MLVWACIAPHGDDLVRKPLQSDRDRAAATRAAMEELGRRCEAAAPETIVVFTPHGVCIEGHVCVSVAHVAAGALDSDDGRLAEASMPLDLELALFAAAEARARGVPVAEAGYIDVRTPMPVFPMDWGALIPLWYLGANWEPPPAVVIACPDRSLPRRSLVAFGRATVAAAARIGRRIAVVCSADQGHAHDPDGPYGYSPASAAYDRAFCRTVRDDALGKLLYWRSDRIEDAQADSYWQALMLHGAIEGTNLKPQLLSYEAPTYFGMACASYDAVEHGGRDGASP